MKEAEKKWLTVGEIARRQFRGLPDTIPGVRAYLIQHGLRNHPDCSRVDDVKGELVYDRSLFFAKNVASRTLNFGDHLPKQKIRTLKKTNGNRNGRIDHHAVSPDKIWLTVNEIFASDFEGLPKSSIAALRWYVKTHHLSKNIKTCRKRKYGGRALEYHASLFTPDAIRARKEPGDIELVEGGYLRIIVALQLSFQPNVTAEELRGRCITQFGKRVMKNSDPAERVAMPSLRSFHQLIRKLSTGAM